MSDDDINDSDLAKHAEGAVAAYREIQSLYAQFAKTGARIILEALDLSEAPVHSVEGRGKSLESFQTKAMIPADTSPVEPKYKEPTKEITDLAGVRVITYFPRTVEVVANLVESQFKVLEKFDKGEELIEEGKFGYQSLHYLVHLSAARTNLPEYQRFEGMIMEVQVRTILQHAWAEMEHDIQYKAESVIPRSIRRRFLALAGMLEIADREFQAIQDEDEELRQAARTSVNLGNFADVEITPDSLKSYLDKHFGADARYNNWSYNLAARQLRRKGFETLRQVDDCVNGLDDGRISRILHGGYRQGQISRFEDSLMAGMGENFIELHPWAKGGFWRDFHRGNLDKLRQAGIEIGCYNPIAADENHQAP